MSLAFLAKKSWHTSNLRNVEKVWIAEQKHANEEKKMAELKKHIEDERQMQELRKLQALNGSKSKHVERLDWMYQGPMSNTTTTSSTDEYLLGKEYKEETDTSDLKKLGDTKYGSLALTKSILPSNDAFSRLNEDPMMYIEKQKKITQESILKNPVQMKKIKAQVEQMLKEKKHKKKIKKEKKKQKKQEKQHSLKDKDPKDERSKHRSLSTESNRSQDSTHHHHSLNRNKKKSYDLEKDERRKHRSLSRDSSRSQDSTRRSNRARCDRSDSPNRGARERKRSRSTDRRRKRKVSVSHDRRRRVESPDRHRYSRSRSRERSRRSSPSSKRRRDRSPSPKHRERRSPEASRPSEYKVSRPDDNGKFGLVHREGAMECKDIDKSTLGPNTKFLEQARAKKQLTEAELRQKLLSRQSTLTREQMLEKAKEMAADAQARDAFLAKKAAEKSAQLKEEEEKINKNPHFLKTMQDAAYLHSDASMGDRIRRNAHYVQKRADASNFLSKS